MIVIPAPAETVAHVAFAPVAATMICPSVPVEPPMFNLPLVTTRSPSVLTKLPAVAVRLPVVAVIPVSEVSEYVLFPIGLFVALFYP